MTETSSKYLIQKKKNKEKQIRFMFLISRIIAVGFYGSIIAGIIYISSFSTTIYMISVITISYLLIKITIERIIEKKKNMIREIENRILSYHKL
jgi:hypothetical protein